MQHCLFVKQILPNNMASFGLLNADVNELNSSNCTINFLQLDFITPNEFLRVRMIMQLYHCRQQVSVTRLASSIVPTVYASHGNSRLLWKSGKSHKLLFLLLQFKATLLNGYASNTVGHSVLANVCVQRFHVQYRIKPPPPFMLTWRSEKLCRTATFVTRFPALFKILRIFNTWNYQQKWSVTDTDSYRNLVC